MDSMERSLYSKPSDRLDYWYDQDRVPDPKFNLASTIEDFRPDIGQAERELVYSIMKKVFFYLLPS